MGSRTMPTFCPHGVCLDWGDFGPDEGPNGEPCERCDNERHGRWVVEVYEPAVAIIADVFREVGVKELADHNARACLARMASHSPPITVERLGGEQVSSDG
jgi:hypothetical protein